MAASTTPTPPPSPAAPAGAAPPATPAAAPASAAQMPAWQLAALARPAILRAGSVVSTAARLAVERLFQSVAQALEQTLDRPVAFDLPADAPAATSVFAMTFSHPALDSGGAKREGMIALDAPLARTILDAMETDFANLRGAGALTEVETGLLEYVGLACVDAMLRGARQARGAAGFAIGRFYKAQEVQDWAKLAGISPGAVSVRIGGRGGLARLYLPNWEALDLATSAWDGGAASAGPSTLITVRLGLPALKLPDGPRLAVGDVILLGATDLAATPGCRLITPMGWSLASATIVRDLADVVSVRCGALDLREWDAAAGAAGEVAGIAIGRATFTIEQISQWRAGATLDLLKELAAPADLYQGLDVIGRGELVQLDGELGLRLTELSTSRDSSTTSH